MSSLCVVSLTLLLLFVGCSARPIYPLPSEGYKGSKQPLQTSRPYNVAHRGSNGEFPEETGPAYLRAIEEGTDFIETDILATKDGVLICHHDVNLDNTSDIADHKEFADRKRTYEVEGVNMTGFFTVDFTWKELRTLRSKQRYSFRDQQYNGKFKIISFEEYIKIALDAPRVVGIYPEIKDPVFINKHVKWSDGKKFEDVFVDILKKYGYKGTYLSKNWLKRPCFIQSFAPSSLVYVSKLTDLPKIFLIDDVTVRTQDTNQPLEMYSPTDGLYCKRVLKFACTKIDYAPSVPVLFNVDGNAFVAHPLANTYEEITSDAYLDYISQYVVGIGPWKDTVVPVENNYLQKPSDLVARAHAHDLQVHPYTFRNENQYLHFNFNQDPYMEYEYWINKIGVDGLFTDFTGSLHNFQKWTSPLSSDDNKNDADPAMLVHRIAKMVSQYND